jgi:Rha family phage regulatory protein
MNSEFIEIIQHNDTPTVSSREVAKRFSKEHKHVLRSIRAIHADLTPEDYSVQFWTHKNQTLIGDETSEVFMSRDAFSLLAFSFTGRDAMVWKKKFLAAFNSMERKIPELIERISELESERAALLASAPSPALTAGKPGATKNMVLVPVMVDTMFGQELQWQKAARDDDRFSDLSRMEGQIKLMMNCMSGMQRKIQELTDRIAIERRK